MARTGDGDPAFFRWTPPEPAPPRRPDRHCVLCDNTRQWHWFVGDVDICQRCVHGRIHRIWYRGMDYRDVTIIAMAKAVITQLEIEHGPRPQA